MSSFDWARRGLLIARLALAEYLKIYPAQIYFLTTLPRLVLQVAFFSLLGLVGGGRDGMTFAFVGACAHAIVLSTVVRGPDVLLDEYHFGTLSRLRLGVISVSHVALWRSWVYVAEGIVSALLTATIVGAALSLTSIALEFWRLVPILLVIGMSTSALGLSIGAVGLMYRGDVLMTNLANYLMLVVCGVVIPLSELGPFEVIGRLMPLTHGLLAIRTAIEGGAWWEPLALEAVVWIGWICLALLLLAWEARRARVKGTDDAG